MGQMCVVVFFGGSVWFGRVQRGSAGLKTRGGLVAKKRRPPNSPEKILPEIHQDQKTIGNGIADRRGRLGPAVDVTTVDLHDRGI